MTDEEARAVNAMRETLKACLLALNSAPQFTFLPGENPLELNLNRNGRASSYALATRIDYVLYSIDHTFAKSNAPSPAKTEPRAGTAS